MHRYLLIILAVTSLLGLSFAVQAAEPVVIASWEYFWPSSEDDRDFDTADWTPLPANLDPGNRNVRTRLWLRAELDPADGDLYLPGVFMLFTVYADGSKVYDFQDFLGSMSTPWHIVPLSDFQNSARTMIVLDVHSDYSRIGFMAPPRQGDAAVIIEQMVRQDLSKLGLTFFYIFLSLAAAVMAIAKRDISFAALGLLALSMAGYGLRYTQSRQFIQPDPAFWFYVWSISFSVMMPAFLIFYLNIFPKSSKLLRHLLRINVLFSGIALLLVLAAVANIQWSTLGNVFTTAFRVLLVASLALVLVSSAMQWRKGNSEAGILLLGILVSLTLALVDVLFALGIIMLEAPMVQWGTFTFILTLVAVLAFRYAATERKISQQALKLAENIREKSLYIADLHDGIGSITSNISALASTDPKQNPDVLNKIQQLATKGQDEIRSFMYSLDEDSERVSALAADMRRFGVDLLDQHGIQLDFRASGQLDEASVSSYTHLNLFRVFKESLQNIITHAKATKVEIRIEVLEDTLVMTVEDNGTGIASVSANSNSRGINGMRERINKLKGTFELVSEQGVSIRIELPLEGGDRE